ncbi:MAG: bifunctional adenosylcobinamide kinase/adenosylcobinamide-phosphate guanylyltransferase [Marinobacterium sp.]|nr:bifunctional adenosylcobinamide kinase/adenosylcobinamide-phosphate guanylyltransferase [Marinobacterium sp.]
MTQKSTEKSLILGGARSGKSRLAEQWASQWQQTEAGRQVVYIATSEPVDAALDERVALHRARRPDHWQLVEEPLALSQALRRHSTDHHCLLVDCLTLWLTNLLILEDEQRLRRELAALNEVLLTLPGPVLMVSNETGLGVVPMGELTRRYVDEAGLLHQQLAQQCDNVLFCVAGLSHVLKGRGI